MTIPSHSHYRLVELTASMIAAYLGRNSVAPQDLPGLITTVYDSLRQRNEQPVTAEPVAAPLQPAVSVRKSVQPDYVVCLDCGKKAKMLKRHLDTAHNLTPDAYRAKWGLRDDYPVVAPEYAARRSEFATKIGLGRSRKG